MIFTMIGPNTKILAKSIQCMSRIGNELYMEERDKGIVLKTVNASRTAFVAVHFNTGFFTKVDVKEENKEDNTCKISMKSFSGVFKNIRRVQFASFSLMQETSNMLIEFKCDFETIKTHNIRLLEPETLNAAYIVDDVPNKISGKCKVFTGIVNYFPHQSSEDELTFHLTKNRLMVTNYDVGAQADRQLMRSTVKIDWNEFDQHTIVDDTKISCSMREIKAMLGLAELVHAIVSFNFNVAGGPLVLAFKNDDLFEAHLVISTVTPETDPPTTEPTKQTEQTEAPLDEPCCSTTLTHRKRKPTIRRGRANEAEVKNPPLTILTSDSSEMFQPGIRNKKQCTEPMQDNTESSSGLSSDGFLFQTEPSGRERRRNLRLAREQALLGTGQEDGCDNAVAPVAIDNAAVDAPAAVNAVADDEFGIDIDMPAIGNDENEVEPDAAALAAVFRDDDALDMELASFLFDDNANLSANTSKSQSVEPIPCSFSGFFKSGATGTQETPAPVSKLLQGRRPTIEQPFVVPQERRSNDSSRNSNEERTSSPFFDLGLNNLNDGNDDQQQQVSIAAADQNRIATDDMSIEFREDATENTDNRGTFDGIVVDEYNAIMRRRKKMRHIFVNCFADTQPSSSTSSDVASDDSQNTLYLEQQKRMNRPCIFLSESDSESD